MTAALEASLADLDFEAAIPCVSKKFCNPDEHPATWWVRLSCGCHYPMCQQSLRIANLRLKIRALTCRHCQSREITIQSVVRV
ncbi:MAG: hypothetical protein WCE30_15885 [Mycobacterium sp.]